MGTFLIVMVKIYTEQWIQILKCFEEHQKERAVNSKNMMTG